jgi:hypothetical protein
MAAALNIIRQSLFAGSPRFTENDLPDLKGKVRRYPSSPPEVLLTLAFQILGNCYHRVKHWRWERNCQDGLQQECKGLHVRTYSNKK